MQGCSLWSPGSHGELSGVQNMVISADTETFNPVDRNLSQESYDEIIENPFISVSDKPLSTFSVDVDRASYANVRRFLTNNQLPPKNAVRIEEMINYFTYNYAKPVGDDPIALYSEVSDCPWNKEHRLARIALQAKSMNLEEAPKSNFVFLLDVSGSMHAADKLPLLQKSFSLLTNNLREEDRVAIVVYAGASGVVLPSTSGKNKQKILKALNELQAGGSTAGAQGLRDAYEIAQKYFIKGGNNRVILATDGDFNVGESSDEAMVKLIEEQREAGIFLSVLGFGRGNMKDSKMEKLADNGNGNYSYIDNLLEAKKVLVNEMGGTLYTVAKDVKLQVEFNPQFVDAYRLIGYENRLLADKDFNDDTKDAGEMGAGHTVTALYEIIPASAAKNTVASVDPLKYQKLSRTEAANSQEMMNVKFRYKDPEGVESKLVVQSVLNSYEPWDGASLDFRFAATVANFGLLLRESAFVKQGDYAQLILAAKAAKGNDENGYRAEFVRLIEMAELVKP